MAISGASLATTDNTAASFDLAGNGLRATAAGDPKAAIQTAARQFEAMFMQQMMKSMHESSANANLLDNGGTQLGNDLLDKQLADKISGAPGGLADVLTRQLERQMNLGAAPAKAAVPAATAAGAPLGKTAKVTPSQEEFLRQHQASAAGAAESTGIPAAFMVAQAAHESGWGRREIKNADGSSAHNLFGIKAGPGWTGKVATALTTEVVDGQPHKVLQKFRAYASYDESFRDYAQMMKDSPRYGRVVASSASPEGFAKGLQRAGYATDPAYADKLTRVINTTLRLQRAVASRVPDSLA